MRALTLPLMDSPNVFLLKKRYSSLEIKKKRFLFYLQSLTVQKYV